MTFANHAKTYGNFTRTENNAVALKSTGNDLLDLFATVGALRNKDNAYVADKFQLAIAEDKLLATKLMFYARNVRGGLGERDTFRKMLASLSRSNPEIVSKNMALIPFFGRWDDLYTLVGTKNEAEMWEFIKRQITLDVIEMREGRPTSLCAKWLKSVNTSSKNSIILGKKTAEALGMTEREYRKTLSALRKHIDLVEVKMSSREWTSINYEAVPSRAMKVYRKAFKTHNPSAFDTFIEKVERGEATIKATTLYPYDILMGGKLHQHYNSGFGSYNSRLTIDVDPVLEVQWKALPNYIDGENNVLVMADTSGSMFTDDGRPIATSVGLAIYFAERNKGAYKNLFLTFSHEPQFVNLKGSTLKSKLECITSINANTNLQKAFEAILQVAIDNNVPEEEMPKSLIVISDMHFDQAEGYGYSARTETFHETMRKKFMANGYVMPTIIYWNVAQRESAFQLSENSSNAMLVSGQSTATFKSILGNIGRTPYAFMVETLNGEEYDCVTV